MREKGEENRVGREIQCKCVGMREGVSAQGELYLERHSVRGSVEGLSSSRLKLEADWWRGC